MIGQKKNDRKEEKRQDKKMTGKWDKYLTLGTYPFSDKTIRTF